MGDDDSETYINISKAEFDFDDESFHIISNEAKDFISKLLVKDIRNRMLAHEALIHSWLDKRRNDNHMTIGSNSANSSDSDIIQEKIINTRNLRRFVIRRRWQKAVNALLALKRMGMNL